MTPIFSTIGHSVMDELFNGTESPGAITRRLFFALQHAGYRPLVLSISQIERYSDDRDFDICAAGNWRGIGRILYEHTKNSSAVLVNFKKNKSGSLGYYFFSKDGFFNFDIFRYACHYGTSHMFFDTRLSTQNVDGMATVSPEDEFLYKLIKGVCRRKDIPDRYYERFYAIIDRVNFDSPVMKPLIDYIGVDNLEYVINEIRSRRKLSSQISRKLALRLARFRNKGILLALWLILRDKFFYFDRLRMPVGIYVRIVVPDEVCWSDVSDKFLETLSHLFPRTRILEKPDEKRKRTIYSRSEADIYYNKTKEFFLYRVTFLPMALIQTIEFLTVILPAKIRDGIVLEEGLPDRTGSPAGSRGRFGTWPADGLRMFPPKPDVVVIFRPAMADPRGGASRARTEGAGLHGGADRADTAFEPDVIYVDESQSPEKMGEHVIERTLEYLHKRTLRRLGIPPCERPRHRKGDRLAPGLENG